MTRGMPGPAIKGRVVCETIASIRSRAGDAAYERLLASLDAASRAAFDGGLVVSQWFPLDAFVRLVEAAIAQLNRGDETSLQRGTEAIVERQLRGVYSMFIRSGSPDAVLRKIAAVHETYFSGVEVAIASCEGRSAVLRYTGFEPQHRLMQHVLVGFYRKALEVSGATRVAVSFTRPIGDPAGHTELVVRWDDAC
jgi:hypothetical protein